MLPYFTVNTVTEMICFLIAAFCLFKEKDPYWKSFMFYMFTVCIVEVTGIYLRKVGLSNHMMYTAFLLVECAVVSCFFYHLFSKYNHKPSLLFIWLGLFLSFYITEIALNKPNHFASRTVAFMSVVFVIASLYFYMLILRDEQFRKLSNYPPFWMVNGFLFFYFGGTICNLSFDYLIQEKLLRHSLSIMYTIFNILNVLLYSCWSYAFICRYRQRKLSF